MRRSIASEAALSEAYCSCPGFVSALSEEIEYPLDDASCRQMISEPAAMWECFSSTFGAATVDKVPGLVCQLGGSLRAQACISPLECAASDTSAAVDCLLAYDNVLDDCNLGSYRSSSPPELIACIDAR